MIDLFSPSFMKDGFCISNKDKSIYLQSHVLCFFGDTAFVILLWFLLKFYAGDLDESHLRPVKSNLVGIFAHGCAHFYLGVDMMKATNFDTPGFVRN